MFDLKFSTLRIPMEESLHGILSIGEPGARVHDHVHPGLFRQLLQMREQQKRIDGVARTWLIVDPSGQDRAHLRSQLADTASLRDDWFEPTPETLSTSGWQGQVIYLGHQHAHRILHTAGAWVDHIVQHMLTEPADHIGFFCSNTLWHDGISVNAQPFRLFKPILRCYGAPGIVCYAHHSHGLQLREAHGEFPCYDLFKTKLLFRCQHTPTNRLALEWAAQVDAHNTLPSYLSFVLDLPTNDVGPEFAAFRLLHAAEPHKAISRHKCQAIKSGLR